MPTVKTSEELFAELSTLTSMSWGEWNDFLACDHDQQTLIVQGYRDMTWAKSPDTLAQVISILSIIGTLAGVVTGVAGAASAVATLRANL
jgi:hypothetical protein